MLDSHVHVFVADVLKSCDTVDRGILDRVLCLLGFGMRISSIMHMYACVLSLLLGLASLGPGMVVFLRVAR